MPVFGLQSDCAVTEITTLLNLYRGKTIVKGMTTITVKVIRQIRKSMIHTVVQKHAKMQQCSHRHISYHQRKYNEGQINVSIQVSSIIQA